MKTVLRIGVPVGFQLSVPTVSVVATTPSTIGILDGDELASGTVMIGTDDDIYFEIPFDPFREEFSLVIQGGLVQQVKFEQVIFEATADDSARKEIGGTRMLLRGEVIEPEDR